MKQHQQKKENRKTQIRMQSEHTETSNTQYTLNLSKKKKEKIK